MPRDPKTALGSDRAILDFITALVSAEVSKHDVLRASSPRGSGAIERRIIKRILDQALNRGLSAEVIAKKVYAAVDRTVARLSKRNDPQNDIDLAGPFNMLPSYKRQPGRSRGSTVTFGLDPEAHLSALDNYERTAEAARKLPDLSFASRHLPDAHEPSRHPTEQQAEPLTLHNVDSAYFDTALAEGFEVKVNPDAGLGLTSTRILEMAVKMAGEMAVAEASNPRQRKSRAKVPGLPEWTAVARRLGMDAKTVQKSVQRLKPYPLSKLFLRIPMEIGQ